MTPFAAFVVFVRAVPWYVWCFGLCFMLGGCTCHALHRVTPSFVAKLPL